ncbi:hypothetical protein Pla110_45630 [Polystyrenella longa]|uniref:Uncharacterized protein n=1 Tax=Polystyrenella longa TaxID=2528007 RepID=A0A518CU91_9PLAN|nr:hypothetical protein [Polystyrenella longa]QDU82800.1 hypothetical protein Pla110_45630 [Polystyrenella longa]
MCDIISVTWRQLPEALINQSGLSAFRRGSGDLEYHFSFKQRSPCLPVWTEGQLSILPWAGYCPRESLDAGCWSERQPESVEIVATLCCDKGIWFTVNEGIRGVLVARRVYVITAPASHYYRIMTRHDRMPVLIGESI